MLDLRDITIDPEFRDLFPAPTADERLELMKSIEQHGFRDRLVVWLNHGILLDGHTRHGIWREVYADDPDREPEVVEMHFADRDAAKRWIILNQLGRRNLSPDQASYLRGLLYEAVPKSKGGRPKENSGQNERSSDAAETVARETGVSPATVRRDAKFARAVDAVGDVAPEVKTAILSGTAKATRQQVAEVATVPEPERKAAAKALVAPKPKTSTGVAVKQPRTVPATTNKPEQPSLSDLQRIWHRSNFAKQREFLAWLGDQPVTIPKWGAAKIDATTEHVAWRVGCVLKMHVLRDWRTTGPEVQRAIGDLMDKLGDLHEQLDELRFAGMTGDEILATADANLQALREQIAARQAEPDPVVEPDLVAAE